MNAWLRLPFAAFAGVMLTAAFAAAPASANEPFAAPAASCRVVVPTFEPRRHEGAASEDVRFVGGAQLRRPVATPCARARRFDV
jgi:hypothetical protein